MDEGKVFNLVKKGILIILAVFGFLSLAFNYYDYSATFFGTTVKSVLSGYKVLDGYPKALVDIGEWLSVYTILHLVVSVVLTAITCYKVYKKQDLDKFAYRVCIVSVILSIVYLINGSMAMDAILEGSQIGEATSGAVWPLVITAVLSIIYVVIDKVLDKKVYSAKVDTPQG